MEENGVLSRKTESAMDVPTCVWWYTCRFIVVAVLFAADRCYPIPPLRSNRPTVDERHGNEDKAVEVDMDTGVLRKTARPGMGTIMAKERVGINIALSHNPYTANTGLFDYSRLDTKSGDKDSLFGRYLLIVSLTQS